MPKCLNDPKRSYKGTEPSPKGLGYCAHAENLNSQILGKDGNMWIVKKNARGSKYWVKIKSDEDKLREFFKKRFIDYGKDMKAFYGLCEKLSEVNEEKTLKIVRERIMKTKKQHIGKFKIESGKAIISDPSYDYSKTDKDSILGTAVYDVENGLWEGYVKIWITNHRPNIAIISLREYSYPSDKISYEHGGSLGVDSGQIVIADADKYPKGGFFDKDKEKWYENLCDVSIKKTAAKIDGGYIFSSGWGDGFYNYDIGKVNGKVVQFIVYLIPQS